MAQDPKMAALGELAKAMAQLKIDKLKGYKKVPMSADKADCTDPECMDPSHDHGESERPMDPEDAMDGGADDATEQDDGKPKGFSQVLEAIARKKKTHKA